MRDQAINGIENVVRGPDQRILYRERPEYIGRNDDYVRECEGLGDWETDVSSYRLERDAKGHPIPQTKIEQLPAPLRLRVLEQDRRYVERKELDAHVTGEITVAKPLQRLPGEERPAMDKLKRLASMSPEQRRAELGASGFPQDAAGRVTQVNRGVPPETIERTPLDRTPRPSYARPEQLDRGESTGRGTIPEGGMKVV